MKINKAVNKLAPSLKELKFGVILSNFEYQLFFFVNIHIITFLKSTLF